MAAHADASAPQAGTATAPVVLIAEDTPEVRDLLVEVLIMEGYSVIAAGDGLEALEALRRYHVDVLLLDLMMPRLNGWELLSRLEQEALAPPSVIVLTAAHDLRGVEQHPLVRATVRKPFDLDHLLDLIRKLT
jgi:CheY-like chemotaxis protein